jgi:hypothetical protein
MKSLHTAYYLIFSFFLLYSLPVFAIPGTIDLLSEERETISRRLDSLDLIKQDLKREGKAITEIELRQTRLKDSLNYVRNQIQATSRESVPSKHRKSPGFIQKPANFFDWIIVIVGGVAFFSGLMLIMGISRSFSSRKNRKAGKKRQTPPPPVKKVNETVHNTPESAFPDLSDSTADSSLTRDVSITSIQHRIARSEPSAIQSAPKIPELPRKSALQSSPRPTDQESSLESQVLAAAKSGLDALAISRKFQISVDHVALLLKMSAPGRK